MLITISIVCILLIAAAALGYRIGHKDGFTLGYAEGSPKHGEIPALRSQVMRLEQALETQTACASIGKVPKPFPFPPPPPPRSVKGERHE